MDSIDHEELSRCFFKETNDALFVFDPDDNRILDANPTAERLTGTRRKQLLGMTLPELLRADDGHTLEELIHAYQSTGFFHSKEGYCLRSNKSTSLVVNLSVSRIHTIPKPLGLIVARDISKRKQAEQALKRANEELEDQVKQRSAELQDANKRLQKDLAERNWLTRIYREAPVGLCCFDTQLRYLDINEWLAALNGLSVEEHLGRSVSELFPKLAAGIESQLRHVIETGEPILQGSVFAETPAQPSVKRYFQHNYDAVKSDDGTVVGVSCAVEEITERKRAEEALQKAHEELEHRVEQRTLQLQAANAQLRSEIEQRTAAEQSHHVNQRRLQLSLNATRTSCWEVNLKTGELVSQRPMVTWLGYEPDEVLSSREWWESLIHPDDVDIRKKALHDHLKGRAPTYECEYRVRGKSGEWYWTLDRGKVVQHGEDGRPLLIAGTDTDITERKQAEEALQERIERYELIAEGANDGIWDWDVLNHRVYLSPRWKELLGLAANEVSNGEEEWNSRIHPDDSPGVMAALQAHLEGKTALFEEEYRLRCKDGSFKWVLSRGLAKRDSNGNVVRMAGSGSDITERKLAEKELRDSELRNRTLLESSPVCTKIIDLDSRLLYMSCAGREQLKISDIEPFYGSAFPPDLYPEPWKRLATEHLERAKSGEISSVDCCVLDMEGNELWYDTTFVPARTTEGRIEHIIVTSVNITERKQAEEQIQQHRKELAHVSRLNTMGEMASGLAHELNQPLAAISMFAETCLIKLNSTAGDDAELSPILEKIRDQSVRAGEIIRGLRKFVNKGAPRTEAIRVPEVIDDVLRFLESEMRGEGIAVDVQMPADLPAVRGDRIQLEQVVLNLIHNAAEAMREIKSDRREIVLQASTSERGTVEITVRDTGPGMSEEVESQVFDAFFTTKSEGMGMGLAICRTIIEAHGGKISVSPNVDRGVTFRIELPEAGEETRNDI